MYLLNFSGLGIRSFDLFDLYKRSTVIVSIFRSQKTIDSIERKKYFSYVFWQFSPLFMPKDRIAPVHLRFFLKIDTFDSLSSIFRSVDHKKDRFDRKTDYRIPNTEIFKKQCTTWGCPWGGWGGPSWGCRRPWPAQRSAAGQNIKVRP